MYHIADVIKNHGANCLIPDAAFHPSGAYFATVYQDVNEVRIFESRTRKLLYVLRNPEARLDEPHGILCTENFLIVSNRHYLKRPSVINVYRNGGSSKEPIQIFQTPFDELREAHSLALRDGRLVATYCDNVSGTGAIVCYGFDQETGIIMNSLDKIESWFSKYGDTKGVCFNEDGTKLLVTFQSDEWVPSYIYDFYEKMLFCFERIINKILSLPSRSISNVIKAIVSRINTSLHSGEADPQKIRPTKNGNKNGITILSVNAEGKIDCIPEQTIVRKKFCRLENIDMLDDICAIPDTLHHAVFLYDMTQDPKLEYPFQTIDLGRTLPHSARFSPDGRLLVITTFGLEVFENEVQWGSWLSPREDKIFVYERL